jgi:Lon protease-like protein
LHIFEPRYRQMTEDALTDDHLVTIVQIRPTPKGSPETEPVPIMEVGCLGRIIQHERLPDGRFHFLLLGCKRVRLGTELPRTRLYRIAEATLLDDQEPDHSLESQRQGLTNAFLQVVARYHRLDPDLSQILESTIPLGVFSDIIAHALNLPPSVKQGFLEETRVDRRVAALQVILQSLLAGEKPARAFPPPFSLN